MAFGDAAEAVPVEHELRLIGEAGVALDMTELSQRELREERPMLSARARHGLKLEGQRYLQPLAYTQSLAESFRSRGGQITSGIRVDRVEPASGGKVTVVRAGKETAFDVAVLASGAWLTRLGKSAGVRSPLADRPWLFLYGQNRDAARRAALPSFAAGRVHARARRHAGGRDHGVPVSRRTARPPQDRRHRPVGERLPGRSPLGVDHVTPGSDPVRSPRTGCP